MRLSTYRGRGDTRRTLFVTEEITIRTEVARWEGGLIADVHYGGQEYYGGATLAGFGRYLSLSLAGPFGWNRLRPWGGKHAEKERRFGIHIANGTARLLVGHDGSTWHSVHRNRFPWLANIRRNQEAILFRWEWIVGRWDAEVIVLDERPCTVYGERWEGDEYAAVQRIVRWTHRNRFQRRTRVDYQWDLRKGIPTDTRGKWGDRYSETYGFGAAARDTDDVDALVRESGVALARRMLELLREWPEGLVPEPAS